MKQKLLHCETLSIHFVSSQLMLCQTLFHVCFTLFHVGETWRNGQMNHHFWEFLRALLLRDPIYGMLQ